MSVSDKRQSNFELLRIISMILIILYHMVLYNGLIWGNSYNWCYALFMNGGKVGVALFIMITGYFMYSRDVKISKLVKLEGQVLFYSLLSLFIFMRVGSRQIIGNDIAKSLFPNLLNTYWFYSGYFALCLFIPFVNKAIRVLKENEFRKLLILGFIFLILIPTLVIYNNSITGAIYLLYYYLLGSYIGMFGSKLVTKLRYLLLGIVISYVGMILFSYMMFKLSLTNYNLSGYIFSITNISSVLVFIVSVCMFLLFKQIKIKSSKIINLFGSVSFGVYLFHDNFLMRDILWNNIFKIGLWNCNIMFIFHGILVAIFIYVVFGIVEYFRSLIMDKFLFNKISNKFFEIVKISKRIAK